VFGNKRKYKYRAKGGCGVAKEAHKKMTAIYSRKSRFTGKGESIENQVALCRRYLQLHGGEEPSICVYEDEGFSGGTLERPQFKKMMADAKAGNLSAIVVYRLDRISRNIGDFAGLIQTLNEQKIAFISIREQFDTTAPMGRAMMYITSVFSQLERETIAERIRDNMHELAKTGRWLGGITPTGYASRQVQRVAVDGKTHRACQLEIVPEEKTVVEMIYHIFLLTQSLTETERRLAEGGFKTKNGRAFSRFSIRAILTNPVYVRADSDARDYFAFCGAEIFAPDDRFDGVGGLLAYNRTEQRPGKTNHLRPVLEWIISVGTHPGLITGADWVKVQEILAQNAARHGGKRSKPTACEDSK
jgi:DNA invertase Pin-like site-specific DNA recombinase